MNQAIESPQRLITELQTRGLRLTRPDQRHVARRGGAGPSDHQAVTIDGTTVMVPIYTESAWQSPFEVESLTNGEQIVQRQNNQLIPLKNVSFASEPRFYSGQTADGVPYSHIATLHSKDVLATTVLQTCIRYESRKKACKFCSIGQSLRAGRTIAEKTPAQLAEVAKAAVELDGVTQMIMTTGTPATPDRGAKVMADSARAIKAVVDIPIQGQCEPPKDPGWYQVMKDAGIDSLGMHIEVLGQALREEVLPGKAEDTLEDYIEAFKQAVAVFGRGQVSTYILAGLGDSQALILEVSERLIEIGVYPFVVPFVPIRGTPLEDHPSPTPEFMEAILKPLGKRLFEAGMTADTGKAGCSKCGACSTLSGYEKAAALEAGASTEASIDRMETGPLTLSGACN
ncbi:MSMEG_0568 family radical SAM protein [Oceanobacter mangrovi]|uniref:MSMEG_0568 family radical SAM protein n=1 Tax=Oceanobacter mangrovi TaxID=2862510 RepID=UPI001C8EFDDE|nr:MSMEG_0568 family radical SAM protein [Oceanobacter mangrovi]